MNGLDILTFLRAVNRQGHPSVAPIAGTSSGILTMYPKESSCRLCLSRVSVSGPKPLLDTKSPTKAGYFLFRNTSFIMQTRAWLETKSHTPSRDHSADALLCLSRVSKNSTSSFCSWSSCRLSSAQAVVTHDCVRASQLSYVPSTSG